MNKKCVFMVFILFMFLLSVPMLTTAQTNNNSIDKTLNSEANPENNIFLKGRIKSINGNMVELEGGALIDLSNIKMVVSIEGAYVFPLSILEPGVFISKATVTASEGQTFLKAKEIRVDSPDTTVFTGKVQSVDLNNSKFMVANQLISFNGATIFLESAPFTGKPGELKLKPGKLVKVATQVKDGKVVAVVVFLDKKIIKIYDSNSLLAN